MDFTEFKISCPSQHNDYSNGYVHEQCLSNKVASCDEEECPLMYLWKKIKESKGE